MPQATQRWNSKEVGDRAGCEPVQVHPRVSQRDTPVSLWREAGPAKVRSQGLKYSA